MGSGPHRIGRWFVALAAVALSAALATGASAGEPFPDFPSQLVVYSEDTPDYWHATCSIAGRSPPRIDCTFAHAGLVREKEPEQRTAVETPPAAGGRVTSARQLASRVFDKPVTVCRLVVDQFTARFSRRGESGKWVYLSEPSGECGIVTTVQLERDPAAPERWIKRRERFATGSAAHCDRIGKSVQTMTWDEREFRFGCDYVRFGRNAANAAKVSASREVSGVRIPD